MTDQFSQQIKQNGISVVLGSFNRKAFLKTTIESIRSNGIDYPYEIIVIDGGSNDGSLAYLAAQKDVVTIIQHNRGKWQGREIERRSWGGFMNLGFKAARGKYICMISDDSLLVPGAVNAGIKCLQDHTEGGKRIGAVAFYWREWPDEEDYKIGLTFGGKMFVNHGLYMRTALEEIGWIDEESYAFYHADGDLCLRLWQAGYEVVDCKKAFVEHFRHANVGLRHDNIEIAASDWKAYNERWGQVEWQDQKDIYEPFIHISNVDPHKTAAQFPADKVTRYKLFIRPLMNLRAILGKQKRKLLSKQNE